MRLNAKDVYAKLHDISFDSLLLGSYGCNLSDQYWMKPLGSDLIYSDVNFFENSFGADLGSITLGTGDVTWLSNNLSLIGPESGSNGNLPKKWSIVNGQRVLVKGGSVLGQEPYNELIGSMLCKCFGVSHVAYQVVSDLDSVYSVCPCCVSCHEDMVSAYDVLHDLHIISKCRWQDVDQYISFCEDYGVSDIRSHIGQMVCVDFLLRNTDRHWNNFGLIRNADSLEYQRVSPLFDFGNSLFHDDMHISLRDGVSKLTGMLLQDDLKYVLDSCDMSWLCKDDVLSWMQSGQHVIRDSNLLRSRKAELSDFLHTRVNDFLLACKSGMDYSFEPEL